MNKERQKEKLAQRLRELLNLNHLEYTIVLRDYDVILLYCLLTDEKEEEMTEPQRIDTYTTVCGLCEDIKNIYCDTGSEDAVIDIAQKIITEAKEKKAATISNIHLKMRKQLKIRSKDEITLTRKEALVIDWLLEQRIKANISANRDQNDMRENPQG